MSVHKGNVIFSTRYGKLSFQHLDLKELSQKSKQWHIYPTLSILLRLALNSWACVGSLFQVPEYKELEMSINLPNL